MTPNAPLSAPPTNPPAPRRMERHSGLADFVALKVLGMPLPCLCPACAARVGEWERNRQGVAERAETLPPAFWTRQAARLAPSGRGAGWAWRWALAPAAGLLLAAALFIFPARSGRAPDDFEARWTEVQAALDRSALGGLEACSVLLEGGGNTLVEELP